MGRTPCSDKSGLKKGPWTAEEDQKLIDYIHQHGHGKWRTLPKNAGLKRCGKSCRLRWANYLRPDIKRGRFSFEEEEAIIQLHRVLGNKWSKIASRLPGRTDNEIKNHWNTHIRKRLLKLGLDPVTHAPRLDLVQLSSFLYSTFYNASSHTHNYLNVPNLLGIGPFMDPELLNLVLSCQGRPEYPSQHQENQLAGLFEINQNQLQSQLLVQQQPNPQNLVQEIQSCNFNSPFQHQPQLTDFGSPSAVLTTTTNHQLGSNYQQACGIANNDNQYQNFQNTCNAFVSHGSTTPSSSPGTALDSSSPAMTYVNSSSTSNEDERDSFCSNILRMYHDLPGGFNVTELL